MELIDRCGAVIEPGVLKVTPHPLTSVDQRIIPFELLPGEYLGPFLRRHVENIDSRTWVVTLGGFEVPGALWERTRPKPGTIIECRGVVKKKVLALAAIVVLAYYAGPIAGAMGFTAGTAVFTAATVAIQVGGSLIINKVLGAKVADVGKLKDSEASPTYKLGGGNNRARQYEPIGLLFGELRITPDFASLPYTMFEGEDQYLYSIFHAGINVNSVGELRIGNTAIEGYEGVTTAALGIDGMPPQALPAWGNVDSVEGGTLIGDPSGNAWVTRTSSAGSVILQIDIEGTLYAMNDNGSFGRAAAQIHAEYRVLGGSWAGFFEPGAQFQSSERAVVITNASTKPIRLTYTRSVPAGQYEVRVQKVTPESAVTKDANVFSWPALRSIQNDTGLYGGMGRLALRIKASGQLNGALDEVSWTAKAKPQLCWDGAVWQTATTRESGLSNPGAHILQYARGFYVFDPRINETVLVAGMGLDDSMIDIESLAGFMLRCTARGFMFDHWFDAPISHDELLSAIAAVGMGSITWQSGKLGVVWAAEDQPIEGVVNMATMKANSFSVNYQTLETADGIEYAYFDRNRNFSWQTLRVSDPTIVNTLNPTRITSVGVTSEAHAAILARFHLAQSIFQRKDITYEADIEHLTYKRMSVLALTHDVTQWGYGGRLAGAYINTDGVTVTLVLDAEVPTAGGARYIALRIPGERGYRVFGASAFTDSRTATLHGAWPAGVPFPGSSPGNPAMDTLWIYDFKATPGYRVRVTSIQPQPRLEGATITVVPDSPEFWNYVNNGTYTPPVNQSLLSRTLPVVGNASVTEELQRQGNTFYTTLTVSFVASGNYSVADIWGSNGGPMQKLGSTQSLSFSFKAGLDEVWSLEVRPFDSLGRVGTSTTVGHAVVGLREVPPNIVDLSISGTILNWSAVNVVDLAGYIFRFHYGQNLDWGTATPLHTGFITQSPFDMVSRPSGPVTIMGKAIDTSGNESVATANVITDLGDAPVANVVEVVDFAEQNFPGVIVGGARATGVLLATDTDSAYGSDEQSFYSADNEAAYELSTYSEMVYTTVEIAITSALTGSVMTLDFASTGTDLRIEYQLAGPGSAYESDNDSAYGMDSDPFYGPPGSWIPWPGQIIAANDVYAFRVRAGAGPVRGSITAFRLIIDAPDIVEFIPDVEILDIGTVVPYTKAFTVIKTVTPTLQANSSGAETIRTDKTYNLSPVLRAYNASNVTVSGATSDVIIKGY